MVANPNRLLKAEMLATARIERILGAGVVIPSQAVSLLGTKHTVMVQTAPGVFESREVGLSYQGPKDTVVSRGLEAGEQVVTENMLLLVREFRIAQSDAKPATNTPIAQVNRAQAAIKTEANEKSEAALTQAKP